MCSGVTDMSVEGAFPLEKLPTEILASIVRSSPDLITLWNFTNASSQVSAIFEASPAEIIEAVMAASLPPQIRNVIRVVAYIRSPSVPYHSLSHLCIHMSKGKSYDSGPRLSSQLSLAVLWSILKSAHQIYQLTRSCLRSFMKRIEESILSFESSADETSLNAALASPSWIEEQRVCRALWKLQMFYELKTLPDSSPTRSVVGDSWLKGLPISRIPFLESDELEEIMTVENYIRGICESPTSIRRGNLWITIPGYCQLPLAVPTSDTDWVSAPEPIFNNSEEDIWRQGIQQLQEKAPGIQYIVFNMRAALRCADLTFIAKAFRPCGLAIWDLERLIASKLLDPGCPPLTDHRRRAPEELVLRWQSLLTPEDLDNFKSMAAEYAEWKARRREEREQRRKLMITLIT